MPPARWQFPGTTKHLWLADVTGTTNVGFLRTTSQSQGDGPSPQPLNHGCSILSFVLLNKTPLKTLTVSLKLDIFVWYSGIGLLTPVYWPTQYM